MDDADLIEVTEGSTSLLVGRQRGDGRGPATAGQGFYNPAMAITRDLTVLVARAFDPPGRPDFLDGLAAAGARGLRVANEAEGWWVTLNDRARRTAMLAQRNIERLGLEEQAVARIGELEVQLAEGSWAMVEVDPYGSPVAFFSAALRNVRDGGIVAFTATDTRALHGVDDEPARRRYMGDPPPRNAPGWKQAAARFFVGAIVREAARYDRVAHPLLVHTHQHAFRAYVRVEEGARAADRALSRVERVALCRSCYGWGRGECPCGKARPTGPYEMGPLQDSAFLDAIVQARGGTDGLAEPEAVDDLLERLQAEAGMSPFYLDVDRAVKVRDLGGPPPREKLVSRLAEQGIQARITHYGPNRLAYDGDSEEVLAVLEELATG